MDKNRETEYPYTVYLNGEVYGNCRAWDTREDTKSLLRGGNRRNNHVQVYCCERLIQDIETVDLVNLPNF